MLEAYLITLTGVILAQSSPGPNFLAVVSAALGQGRAAAMFTVLGIATGMLIWAVAVAIGLASVLTVFPSLLFAMKLIGGAYLIYLATRGVLAAWRGGELSISEKAERKGLFPAFRRGLLVILTNPKAALMWAAVGAYLFGAGLNGWQVAGFGPLAFLSGSIIYGTWGILFSTGFAIKTYARFSRWIEAAMAAAFGALGGSLLIGAYKELDSK